MIRSPFRGGGERTEIGRDLKISQWAAKCSEHYDPEGV